VLFPRDYDAEFDAVFGNPRSRSRTRRSTSARRTTRRAPGRLRGLVRAGQRASSCRSTGCRSGHRGLAGAGVTAAYADCLLDLLAARGLPVRDRILWSQALSPADLEERTGAVGGAIYGTSSNGASAAFLRPANRSPVPGSSSSAGRRTPEAGCRW
jgi:hypothetical protein